MTMRNVLSVILGGGRGTRLYPLTKVRSKPAVPIGGKYRLIDIPISNCLHADLDKIYVLTQFNSASLHRHIKRTYSFDAFSGGFVDILAAEQTQDNPDWYQGTADAVRQQLPHVLHGRVDDVLILSGDHLYRMDYAAFVADHRAAGADVTIAVKEVDRKAAPSFGILKLGADDHIVGFCEKPDSDELLDELRVPGTEGEHAVFLASMGIYLFKPTVLREVLEGNDMADFGKHVIPQALATHHVHGHRFDGYWEDIGTIEAFYRANLALTDGDPEFSFYQPGAPIYTRPRYLAAAALDRCSVDCSIIGDGSDIRDARIVHSLIGIRSIIRPGVRIAHTVMMGADYYETPEQLDQARQSGVPPVGLGRDAIVERAIIDKNARIGDGVRITNEGRLREADGPNYCIRDGIVVIPKSAVVPAGTVI